MDSDSIAAVSQPGLGAAPGADAGPEPAVGDSAVVALPPGRARDIALRLYGAIIEHRLSPGAKLSEDEVGEICGAGRTVVRTALQALAHSGLVTIEKNRGAFVSRPSRREAHEVFEARALIERRVARLAAECMTGPALESLKKHIEAEHAALRGGDMGRALALSGHFHVAIAEIADQAVFSGIVRSLIARSSLIIALYWKRADATCQTHAHDALLGAFAARDGQAAEEIMNSHIVDLHSGLDLADRPETRVSLKDALEA